MFLEALEIFAELSNIVMNRNFTASEQVLKLNLIHACQTTRSSQGQFLLLEEHDHDFQKQLVF